MSERLSDDLLKLLGEKAFLALVEQFGGALVRVHGWVVGERTIGRHALPLVLAYAVEPEPE